VPVKAVPLNPPVCCVLMPTQIEKVPRGLAADDAFERASGERNVRHAGARKEHVLDGADVTKRPRETHKLDQYDD